mmetsp:Transcript_3981/g.7617  ORF Transcript_3981/g.7617 Transcript_3981/m.7617 type:complete len:208 (+) Transcript_3981:121-744(+)
MIYHKSATLHESITSSRTNKFEPFLFQRLAHIPALVALARNISYVLPTVQYRPVVHEGPQKRSERTLPHLLVHILHNFRIVDDRPDLSGMFHHPTICFLRRPGRDYILRVLLRHRRNVLHVKVSKRPAVGLPLVEDGPPGQTRLRALETQLLEQESVGGLFLSPLLGHIMIVEFIATGVEGVPWRRRIVGMGGRNAVGFGARLRSLP